MGSSPISGPAGSVVVALTSLEILFVRDLYVGTFTSLSPISPQPSLPCLDARSAAVPPNPSTARTLTPSVRRRNMASSVSCSGSTISPSTPCIPSPCILRIVTVFARPARPNQTIPSLPNHRRKPRHLLTLRPAVSPSRIPLPPRVPSSSRTVLSNPVPSPPAVRRPEDWRPDL